MANTLTRKSQIKVINNTTGILSFMGMDDKKYQFEKEGSYKTVELSIIEGLYNEHESFITKGYVYFDDKKVYEYLGIPEEVYSKIIPITAIPALLEKTNSEELKEILMESPDPIKENVATIAKKSGIDSKRKSKAIKDATGFDIDGDEE